MNKQDLLFFANEFPNRNVIIKWHRDGTSSLPWLNEGRDIVAAHSAIEYIEATEKVLPSMSRRYSLNKG